MQIPKTFIKDNKEYRYIKQCNENLFMYERIIKQNRAIVALYRECFTKFDLGIATEIIPKPRTANKGGAVNIF